MKFIMNIFAKQVKEYETGAANKQTGKTLLTCSRFIEMSIVFGSPLEKSLDDKSKFAILRLISQENGPN